MTGSLQSMAYKNRYAKSALLFLPALILLGTFFVGPMVMSVYFSFTDITLARAVGGGAEFVGLRNFMHALDDPNMAVVIRNTIIFLGFSGIIGQQCFGFFLAYLMKKRNKSLRRFVGFMVVIGWVTPETVAAFMFTAFFARNGTLNNIIGFFGVAPVTWLFTYPLISVIIANIWKGSAYSMIMFQAALDNVPEEMVESAKIDGANFFQILRHITIPMIKGTVAITFIIVTLGTLGTFGLIFALTGGGPGIASTTLAMYMYQRAFVAYQIGYGMAIALVLLFFGVILSIAYIKVLERNNKSGEGDAI